MITSIIDFFIPLVVTAGFIIYFSGTIFSPLFSFIKNREMEGAFSFLIICLLAIAGLELSAKNFDIPLIAPIVKATLGTCRVLIACIMQMLPIIAYFFIGYAILELASAISGKKLQETAHVAEIAPVQPETEQK